MILIIDNYDSFTYNVYQSLSQLTKEEIKVVRSKETTIEQLASLNPSRVIISPGPGRPEDAGVSVKAVKYFAGKVPLLGICLGHQAIGYAFGAKIIQAKFIKHGIAEEIKLDGHGLFRLIGNKAVFTRYHSLVIDENTLPCGFEVSARAEDGDIMGIRHKTLAIEGVQFHPESIASSCGKQFFMAFLNYRREPFQAATFLNQLIAKKDLSKDQAAFFMENLTEGTLDERVTAAILTAIAAKGPSASELSGCASVLCRKKTPLSVDGSALAEIVGTGGDGKGSFNISSLAAIVASSCGQPMAKHGNRAVSSKSGAADFYQSLGIKIDNTPEATAKLIKETGFGFLFAPIYHSAMRFAGPVRKVLGIKTLMNVLGPLSNPAGATYEVLGVYDSELLEPVAKAAKSLGARRVMAVHSEDGYDEISPCAKTSVFQINEDNKEYRYKINPADFGIGTIAASELTGGTGKDNALLALEVLDGAGRTAIRAAVALNAGSVLYLTGRVQTIKDGYTLALRSIDSGNAKAKLEQIIKASNEC